MAERLTPLPIDDVIGELLSTLERSPSAVLHAPPGAGKTTRVPAALLRLSRSGRLVVMLEPRRVAARAAAARIGFEQGWAVGEEVGYHIRLERRASARTRLLVVTEGLLVRMLLDDPFLERVDTIVFDEFHERSLSSDLAFAMARQLQREARDDLRLLVMSATLDVEPIARFLGGAPVVRSEGRPFAVEVRHLGRPDERNLDGAVEAAVTRAMNETGGDVLVFLPGVGEIRRCADRLSASAARQGFDVCLLYGDLSAAEQERALSAGPRRRVVLSTNVAETSVTVEGVTAVVDTGLSRVKRYDVGSGLDRLELGRISLASARQRTGRAGRTGPGVCFRLWGEAEERAMRAFEEPEIRRVDLASTVLDLAAWGEAEAERFGWFEAPDPVALGQARALLSELGAFDAAGLTRLGQQMAALPVAPRLSRLLLEAHRLGHAEAGCLAAALLSDRDPLRGRREHPGSTDSDLTDRLDWLATPAGRGPARSIERLAEQFAGQLRRVAGPPPTSGMGRDEALGRAVLAGWPDRVARRRAVGSPRAAMTGGRGVVLSAASGVRDAALFVALDLDGGRREDRSEAQVWMASAVEERWLQPGTVVREARCAVDAATGQVRGIDTVRYRDLILSERPAPTPPREQVEAALAEAIRADPAWALGLEGDAARRLVARVRFLAGAMPELELPVVDEAFWREQAETCAIGARSLPEVRDGRACQALRQTLTQAQRTTLDREAPEAVRVPSGSEIRIDYQPEGGPVLSARIQELFGWSDTPRIASGRVPLVLHLLAPNMRPQQVTRDLRSFWSSTYTEVRRELRQRYPKHDWPEDPWVATASRGARRRPPSS